MGGPRHETMRIKGALDHLLADGEEEDARRQSFEQRIVDELKLRITRRDGLVNCRVIRCRRFWPAIDLALERARHVLHEVAQCPRKALRSRGRIQPPVKVIVELLEPFKVALLGDHHE